MIGIHADISEAAYHADPCPAPSLSSSIARLLLRRSPLHAWHAHPRLNPQPDERDGTEASDAGSILHKMLLGKGADITVIDAPDWRTKAAKEAREAAREAGHTPVLKAALAELHDAARDIRHQLQSHPEGCMLFEPGIPEATLIWREGPVWCRARIDYLLHDDRAPPLDLKTTKLSAAPGEWERRLITEYAIQCAFYRRGLAALRRATPAMRFIVGEQDAPHAVAVMCAAPSLQAWADAEVERAIGLWSRCITRGEWPGYPPHTAHIEAPGWLLSQQEERAIRDEYMEAAQ